MVLAVKNPPANGRYIRDECSIAWARKSSDGRNGNHSSILSWRISWTEAPVGLQSTESHRLGHNRSNLALQACMLSPRDSAYIAIKFLVIVVVLNSDTEY